MKISNYILAGFLTFVFGVFLSMFIDAKLHGDNPEKKLGLFYETKKLDSFSVIVAEKNVKIRVHSDTINSVTSHFKNVGSLKTPYEFNEVKISNDTLYLSKGDSLSNIVVRGSAIKKIIGKKNSKINLSGLHSDTLSFELDKTVLKGVLSYAVINFLKIDAKNHSDINLQKMYIRLSDSINGRPKYKALDRVLKQSKITLKDHSKLTMHNIRELVIDADSTSNYKIIK